MATITAPTSPLARNIDVTLSKASQIVSSPFTYSAKTYRYPGERVELVYEFPPMTATEFSAWFNFIDDLEGSVNTFNVNLSTLAGTNFSARTSVAFRLAEGSVAYTKDVHGHYLLSFRAVEAVS